MHTYSLVTLHAPMFGGIGNLRGAVPMTLSIDATYQTVGGKPRFTLIGAEPGATVYWSSYKDGKQTGEFNASYGQVVASNGTVELEGGDWTEDDIGIWIKEVLIQSPDGTSNRAMVQFQVSPAASTNGSEPAATSSGFNLSNIFTGSFNLGGYQIPNLVPIGIGAYFLFIKR